MAAQTTITEDEFKLFCRGKGFTPLPDEYTASHLFFTNPEVATEELCKVARVGVTVLGARVREARATARKAASGTKAAAVEERQEQHSAVQGLPVQARVPHGTASAKVIAELTAQLATATNAAQFSEEVCSILHPQPSTLNPQPSTLGPQPLALNPWPSSLNTWPGPQPLAQTLGTQPLTLAPIAPLPLIIDLERLPEPP